MQLKIAELSSLRTLVIFSEIFDNHGNGSVPKYFE